MSGENQENLLDKRCRILRDGIHPQAMKVLEEMAHMDLPSFQCLGEADAKTAVLQAAVRDGEKGFVLKILKMRAMAGDGGRSIFPDNK